MRATEREDRCVLVVTRYRCEDGNAAGVLAELQEALGALSACSGFVRGAVGRATDDPALWVLCTRWRGVGDYRRALSAYDVKLRAVAVMARAIDEPTAFEVLLATEVDGPGGAPTSTTEPSRRAADADRVGLGETSAPQVPTDLG